MEFCVASFSALPWPRRNKKEYLMDEETLNLSIRKFLKMVGVRSQREIDQAVEGGIREN
jgi:hypothetical protein